VDNADYAMQEDPHLFFLTLEKQTLAPGNGGANPGWPRRRPECLEAREADEIGVTNLLDRNAPTAQKLGMDLFDLVVIEHHGRMRNIERRYIAHGRHETHCDG
jgi:hypothetical protein